VLETCCMRLCAPRLNELQGAVCTMLCTLLHDTVPDTDAVPDAVHSINKMVTLKQKYIAARCCAPHLDELHDAEHGA